MEIQKSLSIDQVEKIISILKDRFDANMARHQDLKWVEIEVKLRGNSEKLWSLNEMETTGGEPDVIQFDPATSEYIFCDCSLETPKDRRSLCYDRQALDSRKENKPKSSVIEVTDAMGVEILNEEQYRKLQLLGKFDTKTSSWIKTPAEIRKLGGALFADYRYGKVFVYHNGAESYYSSRAFRSALRV